MNTRAPTWIGRRALGRFQFRTAHRFVRLHVVDPAQPRNVEQQTARDDAFFGRGDRIRLRAPGRHQRRRAAVVHQRIEENVAQGVQMRMQDAVRREPDEVARDAGPGRRHLVAREQDVVERAALIVLAPHRPVAQFGKKLDERLLGHAEHRFAGHPILLELAPALGMRI